MAQDNDLSQGDKDARKAVDQAKRDNKGSDVTNEVAFTKDGVPVEPSTIPAKEVISPQPDTDRRPDVHVEAVPQDDDK